MKCSEEFAQNWVEFSSFVQKIGFYSFGRVESKIEVSKVNKRLWVTAKNKNENASEFSTEEFVQYIRNETFENHDFPQSSG